MARILAVCTRVDLEITVLREVDILPARAASSGYEARGKEDLMSGKPNLQRTQTGLKVSAGD